MNIKSGLTVAAAIGALILIPVLVIVFLGLYGESIGGVIGSANAQVDLSVRPNRGFSDSRVRIEGRNWPAKAEITVRLSGDRSTDAEEVAGIPLASALSSRSGAFAIELALPASFVSRETGRLLIQAEAVGRDGRRLMSAPVEFVVEPHDNAVEVRVTDAESGLLLEEANVKLRDALGRNVAIRFTDASGIARFDGIQPGGAAIEVSKIDYRRTRMNLSTPRSGVVKADMSLTADPGKRLVMPFGETLSNGQVRVTAVDRASGLRADQFVMDDVTSTPSFPSEIQFFHLFAISSADGREIAQNERPGVETIRAWGHNLAARLPAIVVRARLLGTSANGDVVVVAEASGAGIGRSLTRWFLLESQTGQVKTWRELGQGRFVGGMSFDRRSILVMDNVANRLNLVDVESGMTTASIDGVPAVIVRLAPDYLGSAVYLLEGGTGSVFRVDLATREVSGPIAAIPGATWISTDVTGNRLYLVGRGQDSMTIVSDLESTASLATVPLPVSASWIWVDRDGPYIYAGAGPESDVVVLNSKSHELVDRIQSLNPNPQIFGGG